MILNHSFYLSTQVAMEKYTEVLFHRFMYVFTVTSAFNNLPEVHMEMLI